MDVDRDGERVKYPVEPPVEDRRFDQLGRDVALVVEQHAYNRLSFEQRGRLESFLVELLYATPGMEAVEQRLNAGVARPLRTLAPAPTVTSADCCAAAHELRVLRPVQLAIVVALSDDGRLVMGSAADESPVIDALTERLLDAVERACLPGGKVVEDSVHVVPERERAS